MPDKMKEGESPKAHKDKEKEKQKIGQEMSATITSLKKKTESVKKTREHAMETGENREKDLASKAKATLYKEMKGVARVQNRAKSFGLDTERLEQTQMEANKVYLDKGPGKGPRGAGKKSKGFEEDYEMGEGSPKDVDEENGYVTRSKATKQMQWPKGKGQSPAKKGQDLRSPSQVSTPEPSYTKPPPPRKKDGKFEKKVETPEAQKRNAFDVLMGKEKGKAKRQAVGSKTSIGSSSKKSSATSKVEQEINQEREDERATDIVEQSVYERDIRMREDEVEDLERQLAVKRAEIQRKKERYEREEKEKEKLRKEKEKIRKNKLQRAKEADEKSSGRGSRENAGDDDDVIDDQAPQPKKELYYAKKSSTMPLQEQDMVSLARNVAESVNQEQERRTEEESMSQMARAAVAAVQALETRREERQQSAPSRLEALKVVARKRPELKFEARGKKVDFKSHMGAFLRAMKVEGLAYTDRLTEMKHWFGSIAYLRVAKYMWRDDAEAAFAEAVERLRNEYGEKSDTAEYMLASILEGDSIGAQAHDAICEFTLKLEEVFTMAVETGRDADFNREAIYKKVLTLKLPFLRNKWAWHLTKRGLKKPKFEDLMSFLLLNMKATELLQEYDDNSSSATASDETEFSLCATAAIISDTAGEKSATEQERHIARCPLCAKEHFLDQCNRFRGLMSDEKIDYLISLERCLKCTRKHKTERCWFKHPCQRCGQSHSTTMHDAIGTVILANGMVENC